MKYLLSMPIALKESLTKTAKKIGCSLNALILNILWDWVAQQQAPQYGAEKD